MIQHPISLHANDPHIRYEGVWDIRPAEAVALGFFSTCMLCFFGDTISWEAEGDGDVYLDGYWQGTLHSLQGQTLHPERHMRGGHHLRITVQPVSTFQGVTLRSFCVSEPIDFAQLLCARMETEYRRIQGGQKKGLCPERWEPVAYMSQAPCKGVRLLDGVLRTLFLQNRTRILQDYQLPDYCEGAPPSFLNEGAGWSHWLPASNEGRLLEGAANTLCWEEDEALRQIVQELISRMEARMRPDGYFNYYPEELSYQCCCFPQHTPGTEELTMDRIYSERKNYDRVFWTRGMIAAGRAGEPRALRLLRRMYDWLGRQTDYLPRLLLGGNATNGMPGSPLVYHTEVGRPTDIQLNECFYDQDFWFEVLAEQHPLAISDYPGERPHCYELLALEALADQYRATGKEPYRLALLGGWEIYRSYYKHLGGATAICESGGPYPPQSYYLITGHTGETCGSVFWIWVNHRLLQLDSNNEDYAAEIEESLFNVLLSARTADGLTRYHNSLQGRKDAGSHQNTCCEVSSTMLISSIPSFPYTLDANGVFVHLFVPSVLEDARITLRQETPFPYGGRVCLTVLKASGAPLALRIRIPQWTNGSVSVLVNGCAHQPGQPGKYWELVRQWKKGDQITLELPLYFHLHLYTGLDQAERQQRRYALLFGPLLMALTGTFDGQQTPVVPYSPEELLSKLRPTMKSGVFAVEGIPGLQYRPYFAVQDENFSCFPILRTPSE